jgi:cytochrome c-type biogenesis protein CcmE
MKKIHLILLLVIAASVGVVLVALGNSDSYASFAEAIENPTRTYHVAGKLDLNAPMVYDPHTEANLFHFTMIDNDGKRCKVALHKPRPQDFERSEQIVVIGQMENETFQARDILTKCPSKYNDAPTQTVDL